MSVNRNVAANYLGAGWSALMGLGFVPVYIHYLGIEAYGLIGVLASLQVWVLLLDFGLASSLNREMARFTAGQVPAVRIHQLLQTLQSLFLAVAVLLILLMTGLSSWLSSHWLQLRDLTAQEASTSLRIAGVLVALNWMQVLYRSALIGLQHQVSLTIITAGMATLRAGSCVAVLALVSPSLDGFLLMQCLLALAEAMLLALHLRSKLPPAAVQPRWLELKALQGIWRFAGGLGLIAVLATLLTQVDKILLSKLLPLDQFGAFTLAVTVATSLSLLVTPIHNAAYPRLSELVATGHATALAADYRRLSQFVSIAILPATLVLCAFSQEAIALWTRNTALAHDIAPLTTVWAVGTALNGLMHIPYAAQLAHGWTRLTVVINSIAVLVMVPAMLLAVPRFGAIAAAWIWLSINLAYIVVSVGVMHTRILVDEKWPWYRQAVMAPLMAGGVVTAGMVVVHSAFAPLSPWGELSFLMTCLLFTTAAVGLATPAGREVMAQLRTRHA